MRYCPPISSRTGSSALAVTFWKVLKTEAECHESRSLCPCAWGIQIYGSAAFTASLRLHKTIASVPTRSNNNLILICILIFVLVTSRASKSHSAYRSKHTLYTRRLEFIPLLQAPPLSYSPTPRSPLYHFPLPLPMGLRLDLFKLPLSKDYKYDHMVLKQLTPSPLFIGRRVAPRHKHTKRPMIRVLTLHLIVLCSISERIKKIERERECRCIRLLSTSTSNVVGLYMTVTSAYASSYALFSINRTSLQYVAQFKAISLEMRKKSKKSKAKGLEGKV